MPYFFNQIVMASNCAIIEITLYNGPLCFQFSDLPVAKGDADVRDRHNPTSKYLENSLFHFD